MKNITIDLSKDMGKIKPMHAVNNGPVCSRSDMTSGNFATYKAARFPYARNHDASIDYDYGGSHVVDVNCIFTNFDADENDPAAYDFFLTDILVKNTYDAGTKVFYRLGASIEHWQQKYNTLPPKDFAKWARICEHIIMHYTEGWADGHHYDMEYWEIWNEPDGRLDDDPHKPCWGGTKAQFFEFFTIAAKYLKSRFPHLKIGGPAMAFRYYDWLDEFLDHISSNNVPLDFYSWHVYNTYPEITEELAQMIRAKLDKAGYVNAESIIDEWNYVHDWGEGWGETINRINNIHGAAYCASVMTVSQYQPIDMLMYYDARPTTMNGLFNLYGYKIQKCYYDFIYFAKLYELGNCVDCTRDDSVYAVAAKDDGGKFGAMITCYKNEAEFTDTLTVKIKDASAKNVRVYRLDDENDATDAGTFELVDGKFEISIKNYTVLYVESV